MSRYISTKLVLTLVLALSTTSCQPEQTYLQRLQALRTNLTYYGPAPPDWSDEPRPADVEEVSYESGGLRLKAWLYGLDADPKTAQPALVYFHGGFASDYGECKSTSLFATAGFVVLCPLLRGENGNPGNYELFMGEIDDASAAIRWLAAQPYVDNKHIYAFGHSIGGGVAALLSLRENLPLRHSGSSGGLYWPGFFSPDFTPFDTSNREEVKLRLLLGNIRYMQRPHYAYIGSEDMNFDYAVAQANREIRAKPSMLNIQRVPGDHFSSLEPALRDYLKTIMAETGG